VNYPRVSIIILNWNGLSDTIDCLESLKRATYPSFEVILVDNGSEGNDAQVLKETFGDYIHLIVNDRNYGTSKGFNIGMPDYVMIMNNDIVVAPDFLDELVKVAETDEQIGMVGPKIYYYDYKGRKDVIWSAGGRIRRWYVNIGQQMGEDDDDLPKYQSISTVDWITGALLLIKRSVTEKVGLLDPWYFFGHVDIEYSLRVRSHGFKIVYVPNAKVWHKVGASAKRAHITYANTSAHYHLIKQCFPLYLYIYHLLLLPALLFRWAVLFSIKYRDRHALRTFLSDFTNFIWQRRRQDI